MLDYQSCKKRTLSPYPQQTETTQRKVHETNVQNAYQETEKEVNGLAGQERRNCQDSVQPKEFPR